MKRKTGLSDSPFFPPVSPPDVPSPMPIFPAPPTRDEGTALEAETSYSTPGGVVSRYHDTTIESLRRAVKIFGKEAATHRFTLDEKRAIARIVHTLDMEGIRATENVITRIAINFVVDEFHQRGKDSLIARVLQALNQ